MSTLTLTIPGQPVGKGRPRVLRNGHVYTPDRTASWEATAMTMMQRAWPRAPLDEPCQVHVLAVAQRPKRLMTKRCAPERIWRTTKPDGDNVLKAVCDALQKAGVVRDDSVLADKRVMSLYTAIGESPCVELWLAPIGERLPVLLEVL